MDALERATAILEYIASADNPVSVMEIAKHFGIGKVSAWRTINSLERQQWVLKDQVTGLYTCGYKILQLGLKLLAELDIKKISMPYLMQLRDETGETAILGLRINLERINLAVIESNHPIRYVPQMGIRLPLWLSASGKSMLAYLEDAAKAKVMDEIRGTGIQVYASGKIVDLDKLAEELGEIAKQGFAVSSGERTATATAVAAPIFDHLNQVRGAIVITGPLPRFSIENAISYGPLVSEAATSISTTMQGISDHREKP